MLVSSFILAQVSDSTKKTSGYLPKITTNSDSNTVFEAKRGLYESNEESAKLVIGGYVSTYYAMYDDAIENNGFVQFPTMAPRNHEFGLNMALMTMKYSSKNVRGNVGLHFGDIPNAAWATQYNMIQEANVGVKLMKKLWIDGGFFRSHIGVESIEPRENICSSMSFVDNFEPYFLSGAKLTYEVTDKLLIQLNAFNSWGTFIDNNKNKLVGGSIVYSPNSHWNFAYNFLSGTDTPDSVSLKQVRSYNNFYLTYTSNKFSLGFEANYGWQTHSDLKDNTKTALVYSGLLVGRYQLLKKLGVYARQEYFSDYNRFLTGSINFGKEVFGTTAGFEFKPWKNTAISIEGRNISCDNLIFRQGDKMINQRNELIFCLDVWF